MLKSYLCARSVKNISDLRFFILNTRHLSDGNKGDRGDAPSKLNELLLSIVKEEKPPLSSAPKIDIPKSRAKQRFKKNEKAADETKNLGSRIVHAAKDVATTIEGDKQEIEAQLLHKLLYKDTPVKHEILKASSGNQTLTELLTKMDVERNVPQHEALKDRDFSRPAKVKSVTGERIVKGKITPRRDQRVNLFGEKPLGIFTLQTRHDEEIKLETWSACEEREKRLSGAHPPANHFEQLIDWTNKGVIWKFPIDNEQGMESEKEVSFASHVLLEPHLESWCPPAGPIRHFMELVCVGLSRNHWLTAAEKEQHILWYKDFFTQRKQLVKELGAGDIGETLQDNKSV